MRRCAAVLAFVISTGVLSHAALPQVVDDSRLRGFLITLVLGDTQGASSGSLTPAETKALADLKDFLPYKNYRALDTAPMLGANGPNIMMRGLGDQRYELHMSSKFVSAESRAVMNVDMLRLWDAGTLGGQRPKGAITLIDASFKIALGETVVVGTSRLEGTQALILLVTAVAK